MKIFVALSLLLVSATYCAGASFAVDPTRLELTAAQPMTKILVRNDADTICQSQ
jgi:P pilus assembly chaperone PapD